MDVAFDEAFMIDGSPGIDDNVIVEDGGGLDDRPRHDLAPLSQKDLPGLVMMGMEDCGKTIAKRLVMEKQMLTFKIAGNRSDTQNASGYLGWEVLQEIFIAGEPGDCLPPGGNGGLGWDHEGTDRLLGEGIQQDTGMTTRPDHDQMVRSHGICPGIKVGHGVPHCWHPWNTACTTCRSS